MTSLFIVIPLAGYVILWISGSVFFLVYFKLFNVPIDLKNAVAMIRKLPAPLSLATVALCSFASFFATTKMMLEKAAVSPGASMLFEIGVVSLLCTVVLDLLITVVGERIDIRAFPVNAMYLLAWLAIIPGVLLAGR